MSALRELVTRCAFVLVFMSCFAMLPTGASAAEGTELDLRQELYQRYRTIIAGYLQEAIDLEKPYREDILGKVVDPFSRPLPETTVMEGLIWRRDSLARQLAALDAVHNAFPVELNLGLFFAAADGFMVQAIETIWGLDLDFIRLRVAAVGARHSGEWWDLDGTYGRERDGLIRKLGMGREFEQELETVVARLKPKQDAQLQQTLKDYLAIQADLIARLKNRAGTAWDLHDFNVSRLRAEPARAFARAVYTSFCYDLTERDQSKLKPLTGLAQLRPGKSQLESFLAFNSDLLTVRTVGGLNPPAPTGEPDGTPTIGRSPWHMNKALAAYPVETLRKSSPASVKFGPNDTETEQLAKILIQRLTEFFRLQNEQDRLQSELAALVKQSETAPARIELDGIKTALNEALNQIQNHGTKLESINNAKDKLNEAAAAEGAAETALREARLNIRVLKTGKGYVVAKGGRNPDELKEGINKRIGNWKSNSENLGADKVKPKIDELNDEIRAIDAAVAGALKKETDALDKAKQARAAAQEKFDGTPELTRQDFNDPAWKEAYAKAKGRYQRAVDDLPADERKDAPKLGSEPDQKEIDAAVKYLADAAERIARRYAKIRSDVATKLGELKAKEVEAAKAARLVAAHRAAAAHLAEKTLTRLKGTNANYSIETELGRLKEAADAGKEVLEGGKKKIDKLNQALEAIEEVSNTVKSLNDRLKSVVDLKRLIERIELVGKAFEIIGRVADFGTKALKLRQQFQKGDPEEFLDALGTILDLAAGLTGESEYMPVAGPALNQLLGFYASAVVMADKQIGKIRTAMIEQDITTFFDRAERHLYTLDQVSPPALRTGDPAKVADLLQTRRLVFLIKAKSLGDVQDIGTNPAGLGGR